MKTVIIGAGRMGRRHIQVAQSLGLEVVGVQDQSQEALAAAAEECGLAESQLCRDAETALGRRPECVVVAVTAPAHADYACWAAEAGAKYILCEKPLAVSLAECDRVINLCRRLGARLAVNHQMRFMEQYTIPKQMLNSPAFGGLRSVNVTAGNFGLAMNASHYFEMFRFMANEAPVEVSAWFSAETVPNPRGPQFEDRAGCVRLTTATGKRFYLDCSADQGHGLQVVYGARFGQIVVDELAGNMTWACRKEEHRALPTTRYGMPWDEERRHIQPADSTSPTRAVLAALLKGENCPTGEEGRLAVAALVAATLSDERGHVPVAIAEAEKCKERVFPWA